MKLLTIGQHFDVLKQIGFCGFGNVSFSFDQKIKEIGNAEIHRIVFNKSVEEQPQDKSEKRISSDSIYRDIRNNNYSAFYGHYFDRWAEFKIRESSKQNIPVISFAHDLINSFLPLKNLVIDSTHSNFDSIIVPSYSGKQVISNYLNYINDNYKKKFLGKIEVIPYGIDFTPKMTLSSDKILARKSLRINCDTRYILSVGRFSKLYKTDLIPLIVVFNRIIKNKEFDDVRLILAGSIMDNYYFELVDFINKIGLSEKIVFITNFSNSDKLLIYKAADVFVSLSDHPQETFGISPIEAMACGLPLILSDWNGYKELVIDNKNGYKIPTSINKRLIDDSIIDALGGYSKAIAIDLHMVYERLLLLLKDKLKRQYLGENGVKVAEDSYCWEKIVDRFKLHLNTLNTISRNNPIYNKVKEPSVSKIFNHYYTEIYIQNFKNDQSYWSSFSNEEDQLMSEFKKYTSSQDYLDFFKYKYGM